MEVDKEYRAYRVKFDDTKIFDTHDARYTANKNGGWWAVEPNLAKVNPMTVFPVGARVKYELDDGESLHGFVRVFLPHRDCNQRHVYFDKLVMSNGKYKAITKQSAWVHIDKLREVVKDFDYDNVLTITVNRATRKVVVTDNRGRSTVARCHPDDKFSERIGIIVALRRYLDGFAPGDHIYSVRANGKVRDDLYRGDEKDKELIKHGNAFANKRNAEEAAKKVASVLREFRHD